MPRGYYNSTGLPIQKGRHHSEKTRLIISENKKGNKNCLGKHWKMPEEAKKRISKTLKGKPSWIKKGDKLTEEHRLNIVKSLIGHTRTKGKKLSTEMRIKISKSKARGKDHYNWKGGVTFEDEKIRKSLDYRLWRRTVFIRDDFTCQKCGERGSKNHYIKIEAHHIKPFAIFKELRLTVDNGITLCKKCHLKESKV